jgi:predicted transcriptional regulator
VPLADPQPPSRRGSGELEAAVLSVLWGAGRALSPGEVQQALTGQARAPALAYSTVVTILSRLHAKKALDRRRDGHAFRYSPVADEAGLAARRLAAMLDKEPDRQEVLSRFVGNLPDSDEQLLRSLLGDGGPGAG